MSACTTSTMGFSIAALWSGLRVRREAEDEAGEWCRGPEAIGATAGRSAGASDSKPHLRKAMKGMRLSATRMSDARLLSRRYLTRFRPTVPIPPAISHLGFEDAISQIFALRRVRAVGGRKGPSSVAQ
jgi:hypothetical protein